MCEYIESIRYGFEFAYYLSGTLLVIIALVALKQLEIAREDIRIRSLREAGTLAAQLSHEFAKEIIPLIAAFETACKNAGVTAYCGSVSEIAIPGKNSHLDDWIKEMSLKTESCLEPVVKTAFTLLNILESHAVYFTSKIADEQVGFPAEGAYFCQAAKQLYPIIVIVRKAKGAHYYKPILDLYNVWNASIESESVTIKTHELKQEIEKLNANRKEVKAPPLRPIGT